MGERLGTDHQKTYGGGGGAGEVQKKNSRKGNLNEKKFFKIFMLWRKKNSYKEFDNEKTFLRLENSPPLSPYNFSNGPSLRAVDL